MPAPIAEPESESVSENSEGVVKNGGELSQIVLDFAISPQIANAFIECLAAKLEGYFGLSVSTKNPA